jgi:hypothetical protein
MRAIALSTAAAALVAAAAARPAVAQAAAQAAPRAAAPSDVRRAEVALAATARPVAHYRIRATRAELPTHVTVADSAGDLVASYRVANDPAPRPMAISVSGSDLVLRAATPSGPLTIVLDRQNGDGGRTVTGRWTVGEHEGLLRGRVRR